MQQERWSLLFRGRYRRRWLASELVGAARRFVSRRKLHPRSRFPATLGVFPWPLICPRRVSWRLALAFRDLTHLKVGPVCPVVSPSFVPTFASWCDTFGIFFLVLVSHFPRRWKDLIQYQLLILRTYRHYSGRVWLAYHAFREHAATSKLTDWSAMNVQFFNSPAAGAAVRVSSAQSSTRPEPPNSSFSFVESCKS